MSAAQQPPQQPTPAMVYNPATGQLDSVWVDAEGQHVARLEGSAESTALQTSTWIDKLGQSWRGASLAMVLLVGVVFAIYRWGIPLGADMVAKATPDKVAAKMEVAVLHDLDDSLCKPTALSATRLDQINKGFQELKAATSNRIRPASHATLLFRSCPLIGPNAFNLGRTTIVLTDAMVDFVNGTDDAQGDAALMGVLAHELGHLQNDHVMRGVFQSVGVGLLAAAVLGDVSGLLASAPAVVLRNQCT